MKIRKYCKFCRNSWTLSPEVHKQQQTRSSSLAQG